MGLFGLFGSKEERARGTLQKLAKKLTERYGPPENRQKVIQQLGDLGTPEALETLCLRFTVRVEQGITDDEEKETTRALLVEAGAPAVGPVEKFVTAQEDGIAWGLSDPRGDRAGAGPRDGRPRAHPPRPHLHPRSGEEARPPQVADRAPRRRRRRRGRGRAPAAPRGLLRRRPDQHDPGPRRPHARRGGAGRPHPAPPAGPRQRARPRRGARRPRDPGRRREGPSPERRGAPRRAVLPRSRGAREEAGIDPVTESPTRSAGPPARLVW